MLYHNNSLFTCQIFTVSRFESDQIGSKSFASPKSHVSDTGTGSVSGSGCSRLSQEETRVLIWLAVTKKNKRNCNW